MRLLKYLILAAIGGSAAYAAEAAEDDALKSLINTKIYSASKKEEDPYRSPSAIYVISADDLKQMGVRHVADALRTVPGLQVAKISSNKWMVASRGFGEQFSNKLLVLVDGRPVYTTLFSGVVWDQQDIPISDIKQIEVIRGPGATLWGSNAVNGVINIITKPAGDTLGSHISATTGFTERGHNQTIIEAQQGKELEDGGAARATFRISQDPSYASVQNTPGFDDSWRAGSANFRYDKTPSNKNSLSIQGSIFKGTVDQTYSFPSLVAPFVTKEQDREQSRGGYVQSTWTQAYADEALLTINGYIDYTDWDYAHSNPQYINTGLGGQYDFTLFDDWETVAGGGYKLTADSIQSSPFLIYNPGSYNAQFLDAFAQTKVPLIKDVLDFTVGSKVETNSYDDFALSPSAKLAWYPNHFSMFWTSWSRANRIPSRGTQGLTTIVAGTPGGYVALIPNEDFVPEKLNAYEAGVRINPVSGLHIDTALFYDDYDQLRTFVPGSPTGGFAVARYLTNAGSAKNKGIEISATYQTSPVLRLNAGYSYHDLDFAIDPGATDTAFQNGARKWPAHMFNTRMAYMLSDDVTWNTSVYYTSSLPIISIADYTKVDTNITWSVKDNVEVVLGIDNLLDDYHPEYSAQLYGEAEEIPRLIYVTFKVSL